MGSNPIPSAKPVVNATANVVLFKKTSMEKYSRGRRGWFAKPLGRAKRRPGSNPGFSATLCPKTSVKALVFGHFSTTNGDLL